jgi:hypothetical protein
MKWKFVFLNLCIFKTRVKTHYMEANLNSFITCAKSTHLQNVLHLILGFIFIGWAWYFDFQKLMIYNYMHIHIYIKNLKSRIFLKNGPLHISCHLPFKNDCLSKCWFTTYLWSSPWKTSICDMIIIKLFTWFKNLFQSYIIKMFIKSYKFYKYSKSFQSFFKYIFIF